MCGLCASQCLLVVLVRNPCLYASHDSLRPPPGLVAPDAQLSLRFSIPSLLSSSLPFFYSLSIYFTLSSQLPVFFFSLAFLPQEVGPPRPPLPRSYQPLESSQSFPPSVPPLPLDSNAWLRSMGPHSDIHQEGFKDDKEFGSRKVPQRGGCTTRTRNHTSTVSIFTAWSLLQHQQHLSFTWTYLLHYFPFFTFHLISSVCFYMFMILSYITLSQTKRYHNITSIVRYRKYWNK